MANYWHESRYENVNRQIKNVHCLKTWCYVLKINHKNPSSMWLLITFINPVMISFLCSRISFMLVTMRRVLYLFNTATTFSLVSFFITLLTSVMDWINGSDVRVEERMLPDILDTSLLSPEVRMTSCLKITAVKWGYLKFFMLLEELFCMPTLIQLIPIQPSRFNIFVKSLIHSLWIATRKLLGNLGRTNYP